MKLADHLAELSGRAKFGMVLGLDRVREALAEVGDPHEGLAAVHVTGSNGKGSTSAMVEAIARAAGLRTGLYTSPHLARFAERIRIGGLPIEDAPFESALGRSLRAAGGELTFFECLTVAAFLAFRDAAVDLAVLEVGLGGRLDATNVIARPLACAITSISLEHTAVLGDTIAAIAGEKAGILKPSAPYVVSRVPPEAERVIDAVARSVSAGPKVRIHERGEGSRAAEGVVTFARDPDGTGDLRSLEFAGMGCRSLRSHLVLHGEHQAWNAAAACAVAWCLTARWPAIQDAIGPGLASARWPGRFERIELPNGASLLLDGAHNAEGAEALSRALDEDGVAPERTTLVFGALADKSFEAMLGRIAPRARRRIYTAPKGRAPAPFEALQRIAPGEVVPVPAEALALATAGAAPGETVLVTGSLYLVGEIRAHALGEAMDPIVPL
jgi:dihydrofolate synthase/folylpolyglutamate synthase